MRMKRPATTEMQQELIRVYRRIFPKIQSLNVFGKILSIEVSMDISTFRYTRVFRAIQDLYGGLPVRGFRMSGVGKRYEIRNATPC